jgi:acyl-CoA hydrolase/GNAT superfamily N-acetyltransferase
MDWKLPGMKEKYEKRLCSVDDALLKIEPGSRIFISTGCAEPQYLVRNLERFPKNIADTEILHLVSLSVSSITDARFQNMFRLNTFFIGRAARDAVGRGEADYTPIFLSEIPKIIQSGRLHIDVALVQVTPPDAFGNCSLGVSVETVKAAIEHADYVVAQVNPRMPRTLGNSFVGIDDLDAIVEHDEPIVEFTSREPDETARRIGYYVSRLVPNGSTIQAGIGSIPDAVLKCLMDKKDIGIHTEMFSDGLIDLYQAGVINNSKKTFHPGKIIAAFCMGSRRLYDMIDNNPVFEFYTTDYVSDPRNISRNDGMVAINSALEIDLTGQVCADSLGHQFYSGIGGQADFIRGAALAKNGRPIIAMPSTARKGSVSRIVPVLSPGAGVVTTRGDVHYVVTEYGIAYLHGKSIRERALALINLAHPKFRESLLDEAKNLHFVYQDQELSTGDVEFPERYRQNYKLRDGREIHFRPIRAVDEEGIRRFFYGLSKEDVYFRFMGALRTLPHEKALPLVVLDYEEKFAVVGCAGGEADEEIVAVGRWFLDRATNLAEVAMTVHPDWQRYGIGTFLLDMLVAAARDKGIGGFTAEVISSNVKVMSLLYKSGYSFQRQLDSGTISIVMGFDKQEAQAPDSKATD